MFNKIFLLAMLLMFGGASFSAYAEARTDASLGSLPLNQNVIAQSQVPPAKNPVPRKPQQINQSVQTQPIKPSRSAAMRVF
jgi:hypothetical protein